MKILFKYKGWVYLLKFFSINDWKFYNIINLFCKIIAIKNMNLFRKLYNRIIFKNYINYRNTKFSFMKNIKIFNNFSHIHQFNITKVKYKYI